MVWLRSGQISESKSLNLVKNGTIQKTFFPKRCQIMLSTCSLLLFSASEARPTFEEKSIWNGKKMRRWNTEAKDLKLTFGWKILKDLVLSVARQLPRCWFIRTLVVRLQPLKRFYTQGSKDLFMKIQSTAMMAHTGAD